MPLSPAPINTPMLADGTGSLTPVWQSFFQRIQLLASGTSSGTSVPSGTLLPYLGSTAPSGWLMYTSGSTIGNASSGATLYAHSGAGDLFGALWNSFSDSDAAVSGGRGASAISDFGAGKTIALPNFNCRALGVDGDGTSLTSRAFYAKTGVESVVLTSNELGNAGHTHTSKLHWHTIIYNRRIADAGGAAINGMGNLVANSAAQTYYPNLSNETLSATINSEAPVYATGVSTSDLVSTTVAPVGAHNNIQPIVFLNHIIKL